MTTGSRAGHHSETETTWDLELELATLEILSPPLTNCMALDNLSNVRDSISFSA